ncbi:MAG TPA: hypothetical protein VMJ66_17150 [Geobacteraceae bacterium]|nr:hypothetical protein [Geobacteraceae bacterium]
MSFFSRLYLTALVIRYSLFPHSPVQAGHGVTAAETPAGLVVVTEDKVRFYLADLHRAINPQGEMRLKFPGCLALAAPFLLFRLKREGFSGSRAETTAEGLFLTASR